jgi:hypothetical protein
MLARVIDTCAEHYIMPREQTERELSGPSYVGDLARRKSGMDGIVMIYLEPDERACYTIKHDNKRSCHEDQAFDVCHCLHACAS